MIGERIALLLGLFGAPAILLWLGHRLRDRTARQRGAFWGGAIGHSVAIVVVMARAPVAEAFALSVSTGPV